jgi:lactoylglutathione lyase
MHVEHVAIWTEDVERLRAFYEHYFAAVASARYVNPARGFQSYFLSFASGARLEIMQMAGIPQMPGIPRTIDDARTQFTGYIHLAISVGSQDAVDALTERLRIDGYPVLDGPRYTGDGYYESVVLDPDANRIELTA